MQIHQFPVSVFRPEPPPLWYVTNGELTVGPVVTGLLIKGVNHGRVPDYCHVRTMRGNWRGLQAVREIAAQNGVPVSKLPSNAELAERMRPASRMTDEEELCDLITRLGMICTGAESGMLHYRIRERRELTTLCVLGPISKDRLKYSLPEDDLVLRSALAGKPVCGPPFGATEDALAKRFATSRGGVGSAAMVPIYLGPGLKAMLELSRPGHAFRKDDLKRAERIAQGALRMRWS
ncbi:MAG: hypothetical protein M3020_10060 [Myxococcota bacterium]|jgi:hypothetical protein|nr:hypothetical protein [Myxococcota bacterium]